MEELSFIQSTNLSIRKKIVCHVPGLYLYTGYQSIFLSVQDERKKISYECSYTIF